jgi:hypothetical protein
MIITRPE